MPIRISLLLLLGTLLFVGCGPKYPRCENDENCHAGEYCVDGQCQECRVDSHCAPGQRCADGRCEEIPDYCTSDGDCGENERCERNRCQAFEVTSTPEPVTSEAPPCTVEPVYFDFDVDELDSRARDQVNANFRCARERGIESFQLVGHTDPRGTEEYNLALSDRRARSVKRYLVSLGFAEGQLRTMGRGEEMSTGTDEASYRRDRRVDFIER